jgi:hypothetical protein
MILYKHYNVLPGENHHRPINQLALVIMLDILFDCVLKARDREEGERG